MKKFSVGIWACTIAVVVMMVGFTVSATGAVSNKPSTEKSFRPAAAYKEVGNNKDDLISYKNKVKDKIDKINKDLSPEENVFVTITFNKPLNNDQLKQLVQEHSLKVKTIKGRTIERGTGLRGTMQLAPEDGKLFDEATFEHMISSNDADFKGFIEVVCNVKQENLDHLLQDKLVFLVDPSADNHLVSNPKNKSMVGVFWKLEKYGLVAE